MVKKIVANTRKGIRGGMKNISEIGYHIIVLCLSAGIAMSLPIVATNFLAYWTKVEKEKPIGQPMYATWTRFQVPMKFRESLYRK